MQYYSLIVEIWFTTCRNGMTFQKNLIYEMNLILTNSFKHFSDLADKLNYENLDLKRGPLTSSFSKKFAYFNSIL